MPDEGEGGACKPLSFLNREYGVSGTILVRVWGNRQTVRLTSSSGWASLRLSRVLRH